MYVANSVHVLLSVGGCTESARGDCSFVVAIFQHKKAENSRNFKNQKAEIEFHCFITFAFNVGLRLAWDSVSRLRSVPFGYLSVLCK